MILGFLGKGGSGKSTLATLMTKYLLENGKDILAIDADHNMDFSYNLGVINNVPYFGASAPEVKKYTNTADTSTVRDIFSNKVKDRFNIFPNDPFTEGYAIKIGDELQVMVAGPHTDEIWGGDKCSHSLFTSLKIYLPLLDLKEGQYVVVDEKAGMDSVGTMVPLGFDMAIISVEPTMHSVKTANQISEGLSKYKTPYIFVGNKIIKQADINFLKNNLLSEPITYFNFDTNKTTPFDSPLTEEELNNLREIIDKANKLKSNSESREIRAVNFWSKNNL